MKTAVGAIDRLTVPTPHPMESGRRSLVSRAANVTDPESIRTLQNGLYRVLMNIYLPAMPVPAHFGIDRDSWLDYQKNDEVSAGYAQVTAYYAALEAWKQVASVAANAAKESVS